MSERTDLKIFIASSGELNDERDQSLKVIVELNKHYSHLHLEPVLFELDTSSGNSPTKKRIQDQINPLLDESDIVVVLFYSKVGEFTKEEFERAKIKNKKIILYLKEGFQATNVDSSTKYTEVLKLKEEIERESAIRYDKFNSLSDFNGLLYKDLNKYIGENYEKAPVSDLASLPSALENKYSDYPKPNPLFTGRKDEIKKFKDLFKTNSIFAIEGLGGTGKTQFVAKCIDEIIIDKSKVIWLNGSVQSKFDVFVEAAGYGDVLKGEKKTDLVLYSGLKDLIEKDAKLIFWDNYNDYADIGFSNFLSSANQYLDKSRIVLITKVDPVINGIISLPSIKLSGLNDDAIEYARKVKKCNEKYNAISDLDLIKICYGTEGHPLAIEFSMWLMGYGKSADEIMLHMPELSGIRKVEEFSKRLFLDIFNHSNTSSFERECFLKCSVFKEGFTIDEINFLYDGADVFTSLVGLMDKLLITPKGKSYEIHPLIRSFSYEKLIDKLETHKKAANYFIKQRIEILNPSLEEKIFYHLGEAKDWITIADSVELIGRRFIEQGQLGLINELINKLANFNTYRSVFDILKGDIAQIKGEWDHAKVFFEKASNNIESNIIKAEGMIKYGEILFRQGDPQGALSFYEDAYAFTKKHFLRKEEGRALNDIGLIYSELGDLDLGYEKLNSALAIRKEINDLEGLANTSNNLGVIFNKKDQFSKAFLYFSESLKIAEKRNDKVQLTLYLTNMVYVLIHQNKLKEAIIKNDRALKIIEETGDKLALSSYLGNLGLIFISQRKLKEGLSKLEDSFKIKEEMGDKRGMSGILQNIAWIYSEFKDYGNSIFFYLQSIALNVQIKAKDNQEELIDLIISIRKVIGKEQFEILLNQAYTKLKIELQKNIILSDFLIKQVVNKSIKIGRNDFCHCGSMKKYKFCHWPN